MSKPFFGWISQLLIVSHHSPFEVFACDILIQLTLWNIDNDVEAVVNDRNIFVSGCADSCIIDVASYARFR